MRRQCARGQGGCQGEDAGVVVMLRRGNELAHRGGMLARSRTSVRMFADFYEQLSPSVLRFFARGTHDPHAALDLTAETFAKAFERRHGFRGATDEQAAAWLWTIARNELNRYRRSRTIELAALGRLGLERPDPSDAELRDIERLTAAEEVREHVENALALLPAEQREVLRLRFVEHLGYPEMAEKLGVSAEVVRSRTSRALRSLRGNHHVHHAVQALEA
ncbi:MAG TPA: sigma-70 family RNA polymerase sigma factor [Solirubrobacteraceae bacterium]|nr:sigma-70 family RNA polymerase sigma factor [Solirubrobacteraceae bacterium]